MIRQAEPQDLAAVLALLSEAKLPTDGVAEHLHSFFVVDDGGLIVASAGLELRGDAALLRSLVLRRWAERVDPCRCYISGAGALAPSWRP